MTSMSRPALRFCISMIHSTDETSAGKWPDHMYAYVCAQGVPGNMLVSGVPVTGKSPLYTSSMWTNRQNVRNQPPSPFHNCLFAFNHTAMHTGLVLISQSSDCIRPATEALISPWGRFLHCWPCSKSLKHKPVKAFDSSALTRLPVAPLQIGATARAHKGAKAEERAVEKGGEVLCCENANSTSTREGFSG